MLPVGTNRDSDTVIIPRIYILTASFIFRINQYLISYVAV
jgi:hypothetical protein